MPNLKEIREREALSIRDLAKKSGVSPNTIYRIEQGKESRFVTRRKIAKALEVKPSEIQF